MVILLMPPIVTAGFGVWDADSLAAVLVLSSGVYLGADANSRAGWQLAGAR